MTRTMRAVVITQAGGPEYLAVREMNAPEPGPGEILVRVRASLAQRHQSAVAKCIHDRRMNVTLPANSTRVSQRCSNRIDHADDRRLFLGLRFTIGHFR